MKIEELVWELLRGRLLIVGDYRGSYAEQTGYVDRNSGETMHYIRAIHIIECACRGHLDRAAIYQRLPEEIETPEQAVFPFVKGRLYVFFLMSFRHENGHVTCYLADREPEPLELEGNGIGGQPVAAPQAQPQAVPPNLV